MLPDAYEAPHSIDSAPGKPVRGEATGDTAKEILSAL
jgi:hypothetical protein